MEMNCPNCGAETDVPGVLIPGARLTTTCSKCGAKFGGTVPTRAEPGRGTSGPGMSGSARRESGAKRRENVSGRHGPNADGERRREPHGSEVEDRRPARSGGSGGKRSGERPPHLSGRRSEEPREGAARSKDQDSRPSGLPRGQRRPAGEDAATASTAGRTPLRAVARGLDPERLARLVASDMLLYNREKIERTAKSGSLLSNMAVEIVEAWEFYKGRVGEETAKGTSYFRDAINSVLGEGDPIL